MNSDVWKMFFIQRPQQRPGWVALSVIDEGSTAGQADLLTPMRTDRSPQYKTA